MGSYNRVILMGNLTRDPELRYIPSGTAVTEIGLAVNDRRKNAKGEWVDETTFVDITLWGRTAEIACEYCGKGSPLFIEGRLKLDSWEKDGKKNYKLKVIGDRIQLLSSKGSGGGAGPGSRGGPRPARAGGGGGGGEFGDEGEASFGGGGYDYDEPADTGASRRAAPGNEDDIPF